MLPINAFTQLGWHILVLLSVLFGRRAVLGRFFFAGQKTPRILAKEFRSIWGVGWIVKIGLIFFNLEKSHFPGAFVGWAARNCVYRGQTLPGDGTSTKTRVFWYHNKSIYIDFKWNLKCNRFTVYPSDLVNFPKMRFFEKAINNGRELTLGLEECCP